MRSITRAAHPLDPMPPFAGATPLASVIELTPATRTVRSPLRLITEVAGTDDVLGSVWATCMKRDDVIETKFLCRAAVEALPGRHDGLDVCEGELARRPVLAGTLVRAAAPRIVQHQAGVIESILAHVELLCANGHLDHPGQDEADSESRQIDSGIGPDRGGHTHS